jgi:hypothetical protein
MMKPYYWYLANDKTVSIATKEAEILENRSNHFMYQLIQYKMKEAAYHMMAQKAEELKRYYVYHRGKQEVTNMIKQ